MAETRIEMQCHDARQLLKRVTELLADAAWQAGESENHELDKSLTAAAKTIEGVPVAIDFITEA